MFQKPQLNPEPPQKKRKISREQKRWEDLTARLRGFKKKKKSMDYRWWCV